MNLYIETSAVLNWLLSQSEANQIASLMSQATTPVASELTLAECWRALTRLKASGQDSAQVDDRIARLDRLSKAWTLAPLSFKLLGDLRREFPIEPLRTLDALHLCTALELKTDLPQLAILSLDHRVRENGVALGFTVVP